jgi:hypothetical protein
MSRREVITAKSVGLLLILLSVSASLMARQGTGVLAGQVTDESGAVIVAVRVTASDSKGIEKSVTTDEQGRYVINELASGSYIVRVHLEGFAPYEKSAVVVTAGKRDVLNVKLAVALAKQEIAVGSNGNSLSADPEENRDAVVLRGKDLESLPDNPEELAAVLQAMAGPAAGPNGGQITIDGFSGGTLPSKDTIREIRINQNPFSAENDRMGFGRIEITTRAGGDTYRGTVGAQYNDRRLNARNPFSTNQPPFHFRHYGGTLSGPVFGRRAPALFNVLRREIEDNSLINATVLDPQFNIRSFNTSVVTPRTFLNGSARVDYQIDPKNSLSTRYSHSRFSFDNVGVGEFSLPSRAYEISSSEHVLQISETSILKPTLVNQFRFQLLHSSNDQTGNNDVPTIVVQDAFIGGGSQVGLSFLTTDRWELQNYATWSVGKKTFKFGGRLRGIRLTSSSSSNFGGTYTFLGGMGPVLDADGNVIVDGDGQPVVANLTSLERYRRTLFFQDLGASPQQIAELGGGANYLNIAGGNPVARVTQVDFGGFFHGDWRLRPDFTLSYGLRYENQNNIASNLNFAPRVAVVWAPAVGSQPPKTVFRGGIGIFYERFGESLTLQANRFNGINQQLFHVSDEQVLGLFPNVPSVDVLDRFAVAQNRFLVAEDLSSPYTILSSASIERMLPYNFTVTAVYVNARGVHYLRSRNINAPLPGTFESGVPGTGVRPFGEVGNLFQYEASGIFRQQQLLVSVMNRVHQNFTLYSTYALGDASSDTDGSGTFPANSYDLSGEFSRSSFDFRHRANVGATISLPWAVTLSPLFVLTSSVPFNITTGIDSNGDSVAAERPAFATDLTRPSVRLTRFGALDLDPEPGQRIIPRNFGRGPGFFQMFLQANKTFRFTRPGSGAANAGSSSAAARAPQQPNRPAGAAGDRVYTLTVGFAVSNLLNRTNRETPIGNLSSPSFGQSTAIRALGASGPGGSASNRRIDLQVRLNF